MDFPSLIRQLEDNASRIAALVDGITAEQARRKPQADAWSMLEVINHLYDEERYDFRVRLDIILDRPDSPWPPIDPQGWVLERKYNERELFSSLENFLAERKTSLEWLRSLESPDWQTSVPTPWGSITAGDMFTAWCTHDTLHMRQLVELLHDQLIELASPFSSEYAGPW